VLDSIKDNPLTITSVTKKKGTETPPKLYDLTSLQVDCNRKFSYSADTTLKLIQSLYEKKYTTYPRVDTTFLSDDIFPKCPNTLNGLFKTTFAGQAPYAELVRPLGGKPLRKSKKVFDSSKVTDHHAIIPTGVPPQGLTDMERNVYDLIARAFIAVFYDDCKFETTTVMGEVPQSPQNSQSPLPTSPGGGEEKNSSADGEKILFRTSTKIITDEGWKVVFKNTPQDQDAQSDEANQNSSSPRGGQDGASGPVFRKGESGPHVPSLSEKWTQPPKPYTEATLLRAMETAGRFVDDETLRAALKENGIGRPSSRAGIIETLFKRHYIRRERKNLIATPTGIELIDLIHEELLKSCELTGIWEKKLRDIEHHTYDAQQFITELKQQVSEIVLQVLNDNSNRRITVTTDEDLKKKTPRKKKASSTTTSASSEPKAAKPANAANDSSSNSPLKVGDVCPLCGQGRLIQGKTAIGCSRWREGCTFRQ